MSLGMAMQLMGPGQLAIRFEAKGRRVRCEATGLEAQVQCCLGR